MEYVLVGAAAWLGASLLAGAGWALFHGNVRAREERARAIRAARQGPGLAPAPERSASEAAARQIA